jgi:hypothetical protein
MNVEEFFRKDQDKKNIPQKVINHTMIVDFSNILHASFHSAGKQSNKEQHTAMWRYFIFNSLLSIKNKFKPDEIVLALDHSSWRVKFFEYYKAKRKMARATGTAKEEAEEFFKVADTFAEDLKCLPYKQVHVHGAEGDDIIGILATHLTSVRKKITIVSVDHDLQQMQKYKNVQNYDPIKKHLTVCESPHTFLQDHFLIGDSGDGIPNILSPDNIFLSDNRQFSITKKIREEVNEKGLLKYCKENSLEKNYIRNRKLIELSDQTIPKQVWSDVVYEYTNYDLTGKQTYMHIAGVFDKYNIRFLKDKVPQFMF